jgi:hypothetical protein
VFAWSATSCGLPWSGSRFNSVSTSTHHDRMNGSTTCQRSGTGAVRKHSRCAAHRRAAGAPTNHRAAAGVGRHRASLPGGAPSSTRPRAAIGLHRGVGRWMDKDDRSHAPLSVDAHSVWHVQNQAGACPKMGSSTLLCVMITYGGHDDNTSMHRMRRKIWQKQLKSRFLCVWEMC